MNPIYLMFYSHPIFPNTADNEKPDWNSKTAVPSHDFDEWFDMQHRPTVTGDEGTREYQRCEWRFAFL